MDTPNDYDSEINEFRFRLDVVDKKILCLVAERNSIIEQVGHLKKRHNIPMMQPARVEEVYHSRSTFGRSIGLDEKLVKGLFDALLGHSFAKEQAIIDLEIN